MEIAGRVDDVPRSTLRRALKAYLPSESAHRERHKLHDREAVDLVIRCKRDGMEVVGPRRCIFYFSRSLQVKPDAVVGYCYPDRTVAWLFLEEERGKRTPAGVHRKAGPYRKIRNPNFNPKVRVVCTNVKTANLFASVAQDLDLLAALHRDAMRGPFFGPHSVWRDHNGPADFV